VINEDTTIQTHARLHDKTAELFDGRHSLQNSEINMTIHTTEHQWRRVGMLKPVSFANQISVVENQFETGFGFTGHQA